mgnify:FL=1|tara:strand:- start:379 stop:786 length:408 start_codon:yes stop_codon:yes gene_type:complete
MKAKQMIERRMQVKCDYDDGRMHIQGVSDVVGNRAYGCCVKIRTDVNVSMWLREQEPVLRSAASQELLYTPLTIYEYDNKVCQMFIPGSSCNHPNGAVLDMHPLSDGVSSLLKWAKVSGLIEKAEGEPWMAQEEE